VFFYPVIFCVSSDLAYSPGLGNLMFEYAALHYFAVKFNATIIIAFLPELNLFETDATEVVRGYFQTYDYFQESNLEKSIRTSFQFLPGVLERAEKIFQEAKERSGKKGVDCLYVGVHARHGMDVTMHSVCIYLL
jgi:hypothetical protein